MFVKLPLLFSHRASHREIKLLLSRWSRDSDNLLSQERNIKALRSVSPVVYCLSFLCTRPRRICLIINGRITVLAMKSISVQLGAAENQSGVRHARDWNVRFDSPTVVTGLVVFVGYYLGAKLG